MCLELNALTHEMIACHAGIEIHEIDVLASNCTGVRLIALAINGRAIKYICNKTAEDRNIENMIAALENAESDFISGFMAAARKALNDDEFGYIERNSRRNLAYCRPWRMHDPAEFMPSLADADWKRAGAVWFSFNEDAIKDSAANK